MCAMMELGGLILADLGGQDPLMDRCAWAHGAGQGSGVSRGSELGFVFEV